mgnify:CR=1 FL=1
MTTGKSIRIYLPTGSINGIRHAEIANWTGQAISCPRSEIKSLNDWDEVDSPGVYLLFGADKDDQRQAAYIGEAENVRDRIKNHVSNKDFWNEVICFTNKDESLTKSHVKYLEAILIEKSKEINRYHLQNTVTPNKPTLPRSDRDAMDEFASNIRTLLGALGHKILDSYTTNSASSNNEKQPIRLQLLNKNAYGELVSDGFLVHKDSEMSTNSVKSLQSYSEALRQRLIEDGNVVQGENSFSFTKDTLFSSPSSAASALLGSSRNGLDVWKNAVGKSLKEIEAI